MVYILLAANGVFIASNLLRHEFSLAIWIGVASGWMWLFYDAARRVDLTDRAFIDGFRAGQRYPNS